MERLRNTIGELALPLSVCWGAWEHRAQRYEWINRRIGLVKHFN